MLLPFPRPEWWSVTNSHHDITVTGLSSHSVLQVINKTVIHLTEEHHTSELLLHREATVSPCFLYLYFPRNFYVPMAALLSRSAGCLTKSHSFQ